MAHQTGSDTLTLPAIGGQYLITDRCPSPQYSTGRRTPSQCGSPRFQRRSICSATSTRWQEDCQDSAKSKPSSAKSRTSSAKSRTSSAKSRINSAKSRTNSAKSKTSETNPVLLTELPDDGESLLDVVEYANEKNNQGNVDDVFSDLDSDNELQSLHSKKYIEDVDITVDNGYDTDLEMDDDEWLKGAGEFDATGLKDYIVECNQLGVIPVSYFLRHCHNRDFIMKHHGLGPLGAKAISRPLEVNTTIERIDLTGNCVGPEGGRYIARVLRDNLFITSLNLAENHLRSDGVKLLCNVMKKNKSIRILDLSGNGLRDSDGDMFRDMLLVNQTLRKLVLHHNRFESNAGRCFRDALASNENLKYLDLSWNNFRLQGATFIGEGLMENYGLKEVNLSMNGLGLEGAKAIGHALKHNQSIEMLNLASNRIDKEGAIEIARGLQVNDILKELYLGMNTMKKDGALALIAALNKNENTELCYLNIVGVFVGDDFEDLHKRFNEELHTLKVVHSGVISEKNGMQVNLVDPEEKYQRDPMTKLRKYVEMNGLRLVDMFKQFDRDQSWSLGRDEFARGIKSSGIDLTDDEIELLTDRLDLDGDGEIDYGELVFGDNENRKAKREMLVKKNEFQAVVAAAMEPELDPLDKAFNALLQEP